MLNKRRGILAGVVLAAMLWLFVGLTLAQEEPPVQPADVQDQAAPRALLDQLGTTGLPAGGTVASYRDAAGQWALAADDFVVTETHVPPYTYTAWIVSQVVVRASVDPLISQEQATICFYGDGGVVPSALQGSPCFSGLAAVVTADAGDANYRVMTYTLPSSPLFFTGLRYWLSVQMTGVYASWYWRARTAVSPNYQSFAFTRSSGFQPSSFPLGCDGVWQAQSNSTRCTSAIDWPAGHDMYFKLMGTTFDGVLSPRAYLPLIRR